MKRIIAMLTVATTLGFGLTACSQSTKTETGTKGKKVLVAYFSWSGNTKVAAQHIADKLNADTFEIERVTPYASDYEACTVEAKEEKEKNLRPDIKGRVENMQQYDVVFVGVPVWWYTAPMPVFTFLEQYDLSNKTVIPFCTCYTAEYETLTDLVKATPNSTHGEGLTLVTQELGGKGMEKTFGQIDSWINKLGF